MAVEFVLEINVQTSTRGGYRTFIQNLRTRLGVRSSHNIPALVVQQEPPTQFFELKIQTKDHSVRFRLRMDNLYLIGYQMESGQWLEFKNPLNKYLIPEQGTSFLPYDGSYGKLEQAAGQSLDKTRVGFYNLGYAINQLATSTDGKIRAQSLIVVIMMFCESTRLIPVSSYMAENFDNSRGTSSADYNASNRQLEGLILPWIINVVRNWQTFSAALLRADANPNEKFQLRKNVVRIPPDNKEIRTIADAAAILGILLGLCFYGSGPRRIASMTSDEGLCVLGVTYLQVFSVRIDNIDNKNPGQLYGTITINNGLDTEYVYNRKSNDPESIKPGQNALLTGPDVSISAFGNFIIELLLKSGNNEIIYSDISWFGYEIGKEYDTPLFQKLEGSRGSATVNYAVLRNAVSTKVVVSVEGGGGSTVNVYGQVYAHYGKWEDPNTRCLLFDRASSDYVNVGRGQSIPLQRSMVAVPLNSSLKVTASLYDIANGTVEFPAEITPTTTVKSIAGKAGNQVKVTVYWTFDF